MIRSGENVIEGIPVEVVRKRIRRINIRIHSDGRVSLSVPKWWYPPSESESRQRCPSRGATLKEAETFLKSKWGWVLKTRSEVLSRPPVVRAPVTDEECKALMVTLKELNDEWSKRLGETNVIWKIRRMKTLWGSCHFRKRHIVYSAELAHVPRPMIEYVVVHELTHLKAHNHGSQFYALMDERLPGWKLLRRKLNKRDFGEKAFDAPHRDLSPMRPVRFVQGDLFSECKPIWNGEN